ncbi:hypothetical protein OTSTA763_2667 [Orientia tsutsugamushi str. TA763]|nr:hypothetical protein OTSTA763_2667 [Orientia tsutsugamushi str. TA763]
MKERRKQLQMDGTNPPIPVILMNGEMENVDEYMEIITKLRKRSIRSR